MASFGDLNGDDKDQPLDAPTAMDREQLDVAMGDDGDAGDAQQQVHPTVLANPQPAPGSNSIAVGRNGKPINLQRKQQTEARYNDIMSTGSAQAVPCDRCRVLQIRKPGYQCIRDPTKHAHCAWCIKGRKTCVFPTPPAKAENQIAQSSQPSNVAAQSLEQSIQRARDVVSESSQSVQKSLKRSLDCTSSWFTAANESTAATRRRALASFPRNLAPVQPELWNRIIVRDNQPKTRTREFAGDRYSAAFANVDGEEVEVLLVRPLKKDAQGLYQKPTKKTAGVVNENEDESKAAH